MPSNSKKYIAQTSEMRQVVSRNTRFLCALSKQIKFVVKIRGFQ
jgi:hypothetical protein